jgi:hypothetical protein
MSNKLEIVYDYLRLLLDVVFCDEARIYRDFAEYKMPVTRIELEAMSQNQLTLVHHRYKEYVMLRKKELSIILRQTAKDL